jgi:hypothetical protein
LICRNETTNENLKGSYEVLGNPYNKGAWDNLKHLFKRDKRNWKPEVEIQIIKKDTRSNYKKYSAAKNLVKMSIAS